MESWTSRTVMRENFITPRWTTAWDRWQLSMKGSVLIPEVTNWFLNWGFIVQKSEGESLLKLNSYKYKELFIAELKLDNSIHEKKKVQEVWEAISNWDFDKNSKFSVVILQLRILVTYMELVFPLRESVIDKCYNQRSWLTVSKLELEFQGYKLTNCQKWLSRADTVFYFIFDRDLYRQEKCTP